MFLLDANALIALGDSNRIHHARVQRWFHSQPGLAWATGSPTQNAFLRIVSAASYKHRVGDPEALRAVLSQKGSFPGQQFWVDDVSLVDTHSFPACHSPRTLQTCDCWAWPSIGRAHWPPWKDALIRRKWRVALKHIF